MKKAILTILAILTISISYAQFSIGAYQDLKLAVMQDDYGNEPFTTDVLVKLTYVDGRNVSMSLNHEYASLKEPYNRTSLGIGYNYNIGVFNVITEAETGVIFRNDDIYWPSFGFTSNLMYKVGNFEGGLLIQYVGREFDEWRWSFMPGIKYNF